MAINFPPTPALNDLHPVPAQAGLPQYRWDGTAWVTNTPQDALSYVRRSGDTMTGALVLPADPTTALQSATKQYVDSRDNIRDVRRNRVVNGAMQVSQENYNTASAASAFYCADQWYATFATTGAIGQQRVQLVTINGSKDRYNVNVNSPDATLGAGEFLQIQTNIEGINVADFQWGTASAKQVILRFGFRGSAGTYSIAVLNAATTRSYVANFTITAGQANVDTEQVFVIPGDTTGTWATDTSIGISVRIVLAAFSGYTVPAAGWYATFALGTSANTNALASTSNFYLSDVGLYLDVDNTGIAPKWEMPDPVLELYRCQRYWQGPNNAIVAGYSAATYHIHLWSLLPTPMRVTPAAAFSSISYTNCNSLAVFITAPVSLNFYAAAIALGNASVTFNYTLNARM